MSDDPEIQAIKKRLDLLTESLEITQNSVSLTTQGMIEGLEAVASLEKSVQILIDQGNATFATLEAINQRLDELEGQ